MHLNNVSWFLSSGLPRDRALAKVLEMLGKGRGNITFFPFIFMTKEYRLDLRVRLWCFFHQTCQFLQVNFELLGAKEAPVLKLMNKMHNVCLVQNKRRKLTV